MKPNNKSMKLVTMLMRLLGLWHSTSNAEKFWSNLMLVVAVVSMAFSVYIQGQELYCSRSSIALLTFVAPIATVVFTETAKLMVFIYKRKKVRKLNEFIDDELWRGSCTRKEKQIFSKYDIFCYKTICLGSYLTLGTFSHYVIKPVIGMTINHEREFPFTMGYKASFYESPIFEIYFALELVVTFAVGLCAVTFTSYLFVINQFTAAQFKVLSLNLRPLCDFKERWKGDKNLICQYEALQKLKKYITRHQMLINLTKEMEDLYCYVMLAQIFGSTAQFCFCVLQILLVKTTYDRTIMAMTFLMASLVQFFFYCCSSHAVFEASQNVSQAIYFTKWLKITDPQIRKDFRQLMRIVMVRAQKPCILTVGKFYPLTLATFTSVTATSISYFTVLRQLME